VASLLALGAALCWGAGDFLGGLATRRLAVLTVLAVSQAVGLAGVVLWVAVARDPVPGIAELLPAVLAGVSGLVGLGALYRGLAIGAMGIVAPISAASPLVPLAVDATHGLVPGPVQWLGVAFVLAGIAALALEPAGTGARVASGVGLALIAALGFGLFFVGLDAGADESAPWAVLAARAASVAYPWCHAGRASRQPTSSSPAPGTPSGNGLSPVNPMNSPVESSSTPMALSARASSTMPDLSETLSSALRILTL